MAFRTFAHKNTFQYEDMASGSSHTSNLRTPSPVETAISSSSISSLPSTAVPSYDLQHTVHVITRSGEPSLSLQLLSRAPYASSTPVFHAGDIIKGDVMLWVPSNEAQNISMVEIELRGVTSVAGTSPPHGFLSVRSTLWSDTPGYDMSRTNSGELTRKESTGHSGDIQPSSTSQRQRRSPTKIPYNPFRAAFHSIARSMECRKDATAPSHITPPPQLNILRNRLEASRPHVWPFKLSLPKFIVSREQTTSAALDSASLLAPEGQYSRFHPDVLPGESTEAEGDKGGIRTETVGYGVGWNEGDGGGSSRRYKDKTAKSEWWNAPLEPSLIRMPQPEDKTDSSRSVAESAVLPVDDKLVFRLPPSSECTGVACLEYTIVVTVHRRGALKENWRLQKRFHVPHHSYAEQSKGLPSRAVHQPVVASQLPDPLENPHGWNLMPEVVLHLQPKPLSSSKGAIENFFSKEFVLKLALSRPLCYSGGTTIPFRITVSIPHPYHSPSQNTLRVSRRRKFTVSSPLASHTARFSPSLALSVAPIFHKSRSTASLRSKVILSHVTERVPVPSRRPVTASHRLQEESDRSLVPSTSAIASSVRLVRAIHVGRDANDDRGIRRESESFLHTISTAVIFDDDQTVRNRDAIGSGGETEFKGWKSEQGRLVRTFVGEIPLKGDIKPSFVFPHFVLKYAVVLYPFEACGFIPSSREPLWSEPVTITARPPGKSWTYVG